MFPPVELGRSWEALKPDARMYAVLLEQSLPKVMANGISEVDQLLLQKKVHLDDSSGVVKWSHRNTFA